MFAYQRRKPALEDIVPNVSRPSDLDLVRRMEGLVTLINAMDCLSESVGTWLNISDGGAHGITHELLDQHPWTADDDQAHHLQLGRGEKTVYRTGALWAEIRGHPTRLATADSLVVWSRLPRSVRADLDKGIPIGLALKSLGARRYTDPAVFRYVIDDAGTRRLTAHLKGTLLVGGRPWVRSAEVLDQVIVEHREPSPEALRRWMGWLGSSFPARGRSAVAQPV